LTSCSTVPLNSKETIYDVFTALWLTLFPLSVLFLCASRISALLPLSFHSFNDSIMTSIAHTSTHSQQVDPLRFLADVSCDYHERVCPPHAMSPSSELSAGSSSPSSSVRSVSSAPTSTDMNDVASPHNSPTKSPDSTHETRHRTLRNATTRYPSSGSASVPFISQNKASRRTRKTTNSHLNGRMQMKKKRQELLEKAVKIKSLDNSPVNERQLLVLRMVYDEITMYPCESWMVLLAIVINRLASIIAFCFSRSRSPISQRIQASEKLVF
jgi:hypothetical protein